MKRVLPFILLIALLLCACSNSDGTAYQLSHAYLDGEEVTGQTGSLIIRSSGNCTLSFNGSSSNFQWTEETPEIKVNDLVGTLTCSGDTTTVSFDSIGLQLVFSQTESIDESAQTSEESGDSWEGRMYYTNCEGNFADYDLSSISLSGTISEDTINLYNKAYSDTIPMVSINYEEDECKGGYILSFPLEEYAAKFTRTEENAEDVNNTEFIKSEEYIWNMYNETPKPEENATMTDVLTISGSVRDADGGFTYTIILTPVQ